MGTDDSVKDAPRQPTAATDTLRRLLDGAAASQVVAEAARLRLADQLSTGPKSVAELAEATGAHLPSLEPLLRALVSVSVCAVEADGRFLLTAEGQLLRGDVAGSVAAEAELLGLASYRRAWSELHHTIRTGEPAFERAHGLPLAGYLAQHPEEAALYASASSGTAEPIDGASVLAAYDFSAASTVVHIAGSSEGLLKAILQGAPQLRGVLFHRASIVEPLRARLASLGNDGSASWLERCELLAGEPLDLAPQGGDVYLLAQVLGGWDEPTALRLLATVRRAMGSRSRILVVEAVSGETTNVSEIVGASGLVDRSISMEPLESAAGTELASALETKVTPLRALGQLVFAPATRARSEADYRGLLRRSGFRWLRTIPTGGRACMLEAAPA